MQSVNSLNFEPVKPWPESLPAMTWDGHVYAGFGRTKTSESHTFNQRFEAAFHDAHPHLGLAELTRFYFLSHPFAIDWVFFFQMYRMRYSDQLVETMKLVRSLPPLFQLWIDERGCGPKDIAPLATLNFDDRTRLTHYFAHARPAKSQGVQALEWATDLLLLGRDIFAQIEMSQMFSFEQWFNWLKSERFPERHKKMSELSAQLKRAPWPKHVSAHTVEIGDRLASELKIVFSEPDQLAMMADQLKNCAQFLKQNVGYSAQR